MTQPVCKFCDKPMSEVSGWKSFPVPDVWECHTIDCRANPRCTRIEGFRTPHCLDVFVDGVRLDPAVSQGVRNHSPDGFNAGYGGSGVAQTALAILLMVADEQIATRHYQDFKWEFLAKREYLDKSFKFYLDIGTWLDAKEREKGGAE